MLMGGYASYTGWSHQSILLLGNYTNVVMIGSLLSQYNPMSSILDFEILLRKKSAKVLDTERIKGIICIASKDFKVESLFHPYIIYLMQRPIKVTTLVTKDITLPEELKGTKQIDITGNSEDWLPDFITTIQKMCKHN